MANKIHDTIIITMSSLKTQLETKPVSNIGHLHHCSFRGDYILIKLGKHMKLS